MDTPSFGECQSGIAGILQTVAQDLTIVLCYERPVAERIVGGTIAYYLDERFSVTNRRLLGFT